jgi:DNA (cytosine-5)-methyltransferase 1
MTEQMSIFDGHIPYYKIDKPIRLIELFAGIGSQHLALKRQNFKIDKTTICEWSVQSTQAYNDAHIQDYTDYSKDKTKEWLVNYLSEKGISSNWEQPLTKQQINRKSLEWLKTTYNNIVATNNLVNITQVKGEDLQIDDTYNYTYIMSYSFPCQDLSMVGSRKGMSRDGQTRSGMLWEVERLLKETKKLPHILLMENVPEVIGQTNIEYFREWELFLRNLGYSNHCELLNAKHYGMPQNRNRCFMVSILGEWQYKFPPKEKLTLQRKDMLETEVDEKYCLSEKLIKTFLTNSHPKYDRQQRFIKNIFKKTEVANTITTRAGDRPTDNFVVLGGGHTPRLVNDLWIRKLTPKECWRLMGFDDEIFERVEKSQSKSSLYHLAGDSIVVNVLENIFRQFV